MSDHNETRDNMSDLDAIERLANALAVHFTANCVGKRNPDWDWEGPDDETNPLYLPLTIEERRSFGPYVHFVAEDGHRSFRAATFQEIAAAVLRVNG